MADGDKANIFTQSFLSRLVQEIVLSVLFYENYFNEICLKLISFIEKIYLILLKVNW